MDIGKLAAKLLAKLGNLEIDQNEAVHQLGDSVTYPVGKNLNDSSLIAERMCQILKHDVPQSIASKARACHITFSLIEKDDGLQIIPDIKEPRDVPVVLAILASLKKRPEKFSSCEWCRRYFLSKTKRGSRFCSPKCRWTQKNGRK